MPRGKVLDSGTNKWDNLHFTPNLILYLIRIYFRWITVLLCNWERPTSWFNFCAFPQVIPTGEESVLLPCRYLKAQLRAISVCDEMGAGGELSSMHQGFAAAWVQDCANSDCWAAQPASRISFLSPCRSACPGHEEESLKTSFSPVLCFWTSCCFQWMFSPWLHVVLLDVCSMCPQCDSSAQGALSKSDPHHLPLGLSAVLWRIIKSLLLLHCIKIEASASITKFSSDLLAQSGCPSSSYCRFIFLDIGVYDHKQKLGPKLQSANPVPLRLVGDQSLVSKGVGSSSARRTPSLSIYCAGFHGTAFEMQWRCISMAH